ncbi:BAG domain-containing protein Samui-like [Centruroides sculpturatus]|uniref:BAG domain-containing protein Samui-like n=1 Tax=Centruroides sculpturatus TaxID=218467 RepID=UPI000C6E933A|nr:BAG domain-containing protein Samui-like [Centruroides sculpturatus]
MFYDPTPPLSSSWSEWSERMSRPSHYDDMEWGRPFREYTGSYTNPRIRRFDFADESPRMSRTSSRSDVESMPETDESIEQEGKPPRVHRIPIMVECRDEFQSTSRPQTPESSRIQEDMPRFTDFETQQSNTVPRRRRRNVVEEDIQRSQSQSSAEPMYHKFANKVPERRRRNVTTVKVNCEPEEVKEKSSDQSTEIESIIKEVEDLKTQVENLTEVQDKLYRYLDEMLTRCMLKLDNIDTMGSEDIRLARKNAIGRVQSCIDLLELKAHPPPPPSPPPPPKPSQTDNQNSDCENTVISLPFYDKQPSREETMSQTEQVCSKDEKDDNVEPNKSIIVLPYYKTTEVTHPDPQKDKTDKNEDVEPNKNVIVLPYEKSENEQKTPEKTVIMLPFHENKEENKNVIPLPFHESVGCNDSCSESYCTKL